MGDAFQARAGGPSDLSRSASQPEALIAIAERCEQATGPDRELDWTIYEAIGSPTKPIDGGIGVQTWAARYTASLDAAMTLVPEGAHCGMGQDAGPEGKGWAWVRCKVGCQWQEFSCEPRFVANMTLALCAAALRARAAQ